MAFKITSHELVLKHTKLNDSEKEKLFHTYNISTRDLPKIFKSDSAIAELNPKVGDVIKIERKSKTAGTTDYYRAVFEE